MLIEMNKSKIKFSQPRYWYVQYKKLSLLNLFELWLHILATITHYQVNKAIIKLIPNILNVNTFKYPVHWPGKQAHLVSHLTTEFGWKYKHYISDTKKCYTVDWILKYVKFCIFGIKNDLELTW